MRLFTLFAFSLTTTTLLAQGFTDEQRAELRKIIRSEIQSAVKELHGSGTGMWVASPTTAVEFKGGAAKAGAPHSFQLRVDGDAKAKAGKGQVVELTDVTVETPPAAPKANAGKALAVTLDGNHIVQLGEGHAKTFVLGHGGEGIREWKLGDVKLDCCELGGKSGEAMVIKLDGGDLQVVEGKPIRLDLGRRAGGTSATVAIEGAKECCEHECAEAKECEAKESECCEVAVTAEKSECCDAEKTEKAAKKAAKKAKKAKAKKAKLKAGEGTLEIAVEGELPAEIKKAIESALREIH